MKKYSEDSKNDLHQILSIEVKINAIKMINFMNTQSKNFFIRRQEYYIHLRKYLCSL